MTIPYTEEMKEISRKVHPYREFSNGKIRFREGTPKEIIDLSNKLSKLIDEQEKLELSLM